MTNELSHTSYRWKLTTKQKGTSSAHCILNLFSTTYYVFHHSYLIFCPISLKQILSKIYDLITCVFKFNNIFFFLFFLNSGILLALLWSLAWMVWSGSTLEVSWMFLDVFTVSLDAIFLNNLQLHLFLYILGGRYSPMDMVRNICRDRGRNMKLIGDSLIAFIFNWLIYIFLLLTSSSNPILGLLRSKFSLLLNDAKLGSQKFPFFFIVLND